MSADPNNTEMRFEGTFSGSDYIIIVRSQRSETLSIHLESKYEPVWWNGTFTAGYLEDLTQRTGMRRSYSEFLSALISGFSKRSQSSNVDILTFADLQALRNGGGGQHQGGQSQQLSSSQQSIKKSPVTTSTPTSAQLSKRYLIVTAESNSNSSSTNERVHYPLSLSLDDIDNVDQLKQQIRKMKVEMEDLKSSSRSSYSEDPSSSKSSFSSRLRAAAGDTSKGFFLTDQITASHNHQSSSQSSLNTTHSDIEILKSENDLLRTKIKRIEEQGAQKRGAVELDNIAKTKLELEEELETTRRESFGQIERLRQSLQQKDLELSRSRNQLKELQREMSSLESGSASEEESALKFRSIISRITTETEEETHKQRRQIEQQSRELDRWVNEAETLKLADRKQKQRIKQLETELETAVKRVSSKTTTDRLYSPFNRTNTSSTNPVNRRSTSVPSRSSQSPTTRTNNNTMSGANLRYQNSNTSSRNSSNSLGRSQSVTGTSPSYQRRTVGGTVAPIGNSPIGQNSNTLRRNVSPSLGSTNNAANRNSQGTFVSQRNRSPSSALPSSNIARSRSPGISSLNNVASLVKNRSPGQSFNQPPQASNLARSRSPQSTVSAASSNQLRNRSPVQGDKTGKWFGTNNQSKTTSSTLQQQQQNSRQNNSGSLTRQTQPQRISPAARTTMNGQQRAQQTNNYSNTTRSGIQGRTPPGSSSTTVYQRPGGPTPRVGNYLSTKESMQGSLKSIVEVPPPVEKATDKNARKLYLPQELQDFRTDTMASVEASAEPNRLLTTEEDIDQKLSKLQGLLKLAKK